PSQGFVKPLTSVTGLGWSVVAIHRDAVWHKFSLRVLLLALFGCALMTPPLVILAAVACWYLARVSRPRAASSQERRPPPTWYFPDPTKRHLYLVLLSAYIVLIFIGMWTSSSWAALWLPVTAILLTWAGLWGHYACRFLVASKPTRDIRAAMAILYTSNATLV